VRAARAALLAVPFAGAFLAELDDGFAEAFPLCAWLWLVCPFVVCAAGELPADVELSPACAGVTGSPGPREASS
jgi:hypothetical protein